jgi:hypothetical protein
MQGVLAFVMHCADTVVGTLNDESCWQDSYAKYAEKPNAFIPRKYRFRWRSIVLFLAKSVLQFVFGYAITIDIRLQVWFLPLIVLTVTILLTTIMLEWVVRREPSAGGPTTYGEFRLLFNYIQRHHLVWL